MTVAFAGRGGEPSRTALAVLAVITASAVLVGAVAWTVVRPRSGSRATASTAAVAFLQRYVDADGRVVRRDQGGDTVSEGQAYAMLLALAANDGAQFARTWHWTTEHLQQPDGLLAWHWANGAVADPMAAADADVGAAWALSIAAQRFGRTEYRTEATRLAGAVLDRETAVVEGQPVLVAGPWAKTPPYTINPGYLPAPAANALADLTGDDTWRTLLESGHRLTDRLTEHGQRLPSDWAKVNPNGDVWPDPGPAGGATAFGLDGARVLLWAGADCTERAAAAVAHPLLTGDPATARRELDGRPATSDRQPVMLAASAAAAAAAGDKAGSHRMFTDAERLDAKQPSYFGAAWVGLSDALYRTHTLPSCPTEER